MKNHRLHGALAVAVFLAGTVAARADLSVMLRNGEGYGLPHSMSVAAGSTFRVFIELDGVPEGGLTAGNLMIGASESDVFVLTDIEYGVGWSNDETQVVQTPLPSLMGPGGTGVGTVAFGGFGSTTTSTDFATLEFWVRPGSYDYSFMLYICEESPSFGIPGPGVIPADVGAGVEVTVIPAPEAALLGFLGLCLAAGHARASRRGSSTAAVT